MLEYFLQFLDEIFSPDPDLLEVVVEYSDSSALKRSRHLLDICTLLAGEGQCYLVLLVLGNQSTFSLRSLARCLRLV